MELIEEKNIKNVDTLHPLVRSQVYDILNRSNTKEVNYIVSLAYVDMLDNSKILGVHIGKGLSYHNYGLAFRIVPIRNGVEILNEPKLFQDFAKIAKSKGWEWGGDFSSFKDMPHFQKSFGKRPIDYYHIVKNSGRKYPIV